RALLSSPSAYPLALHPFPTRRSSDLLLAAAVDPQLPVRMRRRDLGEGADQQVIALDGDQPAGGDDDLRLAVGGRHVRRGDAVGEDRKSTRLNSSHQIISYAVFCLKKK